MRISAILFPLLASRAQKREVAAVANAFIRGFIHRHRESPVLRFHLYVQDIFAIQMLRSKSTATVGELIFFLSNEFAPYHTPSEQIRGCLLLIASNADDRQNDECQHTETGGGR